MMATWYTGRGFAVGCRMCRPNVPAGLDSEVDRVLSMNGKSSSSMRSHHGLYEVHLPVTDLDRAIDFYVEKLGFELGFGERGGPSALLLFSEGDTRWMLGLFRVDAVVHRHSAEYHISLRVAEEDVDRMVPYLRDRGIEPVYPPTAHLQGTMDEPIVHGWILARCLLLNDICLP